MMKYVDHHGFPIVTFVDTPVAFADLKSLEEMVAHRMGNPGYLVEVQALRVTVDNEFGKKATLIKVDNANKRGSLLEVVQVLTDLKLIIRRAYISSDGEWLMDVFHVTDDYGNKFYEDNISERIHQGDADLAAKSDQPKAATKKSKDGGKDQDYVKLVKAGSGCEDTNKVEQTAIFSPNEKFPSESIVTIAFLKLFATNPLKMFLDLKPEVTKDKEDKKETTE
ncbi:hypothetical protein BUALT_Bualt12G0144800 [Buddleja alternifolia]|uniref:ACT domain-containing protein ACR n=1 Tax=Buddleja alternifolia TaxID=168488 RepID=A0AAV6X241_9LAMI|nr:hypothetical protein BUALT_Bualt12G0144800 [Buddleja alternifolia]